MKIVPPDVVQVGNANVNASVVQGAQKTRDDDVQQREDCVRLVSESLVGDLGDPEERPQVIVFTDDVLDGVGVDGVDVASPRCVLEVVMLVDVGVQPFEVEHSVEKAVEEIVEDDDNGEEDSEDGELGESVADGGSPRRSGEDEVFHAEERVIAGKKNKVVQEHDSDEAVELDHGIVREGEDHVAARLVREDAVADRPIGERDEHVVEEAESNVDDDGEEDVVREFLKG